MGRRHRKVVKAEEDPRINSWLPSLRILLHSVISFSDDNHPEALGKEKRHTDTLIFYTVREYALGTGT